MKGSERGSTSGHLIATGGGKSGGVLPELLDLGEAFLALKPMLVAGHAPVGKVLRRNGFAVELGGQDFFDGLEVVEPGEDDGGGVAIQEALVELFADIVGEAGDFATARGRPGFPGQVDSFVSHAAILPEKRQTHS